MLSRILPLLNNLIPKNLAFKGLSKIDPRIGRFLTSAASAGYTMDQALDYIRNQTQPQEIQGSRPGEKAANKRVKQGTAIPELLGKAGTTALGVAGIQAVPQVLGNMFENKEENSQQAGQVPEQAPQTQQSTTKNIVEETSPELHQFISQELSKGRSIIETAALSQNNKRFSSIVNNLMKSQKTPWSSIVESIYGGQRGKEQGNKQQPQQNPQADDTALIDAFSKILKM
jgi:hypothetical protein